MSHKLFIICGEPSGDLHGANLIEELKKSDPKIEIQCWGGDKMAAAGGRVMKHIDELAFMGFVEVLLNIRAILQNFKLCKGHISTFNPDAVLLIDYPGFNLRMAKHIYEMGIPVHYYISPQIWAWKESRVKKIKAYIQRVFVILPFESDFYKKHGVEAEFVGHPLLDELNKHHYDTDLFKANHELNPDMKVVAFLPGSRSQEIKRMLPLANELATKLSGHQFVVSKVHWHPESLYRLMLKDNIKLVEGDTYDLIRSSEVCVVTSGTATLETALIGTPQVVVYKSDPISVRIARWLIKIKYISLVNLIMDEMVVRELIQEEASVANLEKELLSIMTGGDKRQQVLDKYQQLQQILGSGGASKIVATRLLKSMEAT
ncbi:MAG: lipid-A-disaccharide synthase [Flavobacteriales bacterium]|jgi:lipid-A-disaccharide synthase|nr:lipid-A-disaccharide synthase [Flavobacteriales bacterium]